jgi:uncharacterized delta-60 repeat protein
MSPRILQASSYLIAFAVAILLAACGGGSAGGDSQLPPGSIDPTFGSGGTVVNASGNVVGSMALQPDGKIVVAAGILMRFERNGGLDATFGTAGVVSGPIGANSVALQPDGKLIVAGTFPLSFESTDCIVARYLANGTIDATFGTGGIVQADFGGSHSSCDDVIVQPDGSIVVAAGSVPFTT